MQRTLDVYAQMQQRAKRDNGAKFDRLIRAAREQAAEPAEDPVRVNRDRFGTANGTKEAKKPARERHGRLVAKPKTRRFAGHSPMEPTGIEPVTSCLQSRRSPS
jgi:hypothetical protein